MTTEIPDAAIEAVMDYFDGAATHDESEAAVIAALPHLRAAILADLRERCERESALLEAESKCTVSQRRHLASKAEGVRVALSHIGDAERTGL